MQKPTHKMKFFVCSNANFFAFKPSYFDGAVLSNSLSLLGDAAAMSVDVFAYLCNLLAEHCRSRYGSISHNMMLLLDVGIPCISVCALLGVTGYIFSSAVIVLIENGEVQIETETVDVHFLYGFSAANLFVDAICSLIACQRGKNILYRTHTIPLSSLCANDRVDSDSEMATIDITTERQGSIDESPPILQKNLNMISALTHVGGDTLRTCSVLTAAFISTFAGINSDVADAWASIMVTATILLIVLPLTKEIYHEYNRIMQPNTNDSKI
eukprot:gene4267-8491_t